MVQVPLGSLSLWLPIPADPCLAGCPSCGSLPCWAPVPLVPALCPTMCPSPGCLLCGALPSLCQPVDELPADTALEEATAAVAGVDAIVLPTAGVTTHLAQQHGAQRLARGRAQPCRRGATTFRVTQDTPISLIPPVSLLLPSILVMGWLPSLLVQPRDMDEDTSGTSGTAHVVQHLPTPQNPGYCRQSSHKPFQNKRG